MRVLALVVLAPTLLLGGILVSGDRLLPHLPVMLEPLASEHPEAAAEAREGVSFGPSDRVFPVLSDQIVARREVTWGALPTWEPDLGLGAPLFANSIAGLGYPPNWLALVLAPDRAAAPLAWLTLMIAGLGMALFLRRLGFGPFAVAAGVIGVQVGGWGVSNLVYFMKVDAVVWFPWCLWAAEGMARGVRRSGLWLVLFTALSLLAGFPPIATFSIAAALAYACIRVYQEQDPGDSHVIAGLARTALLFALGFGVAAWQLLPMFEASGQSLRQGNSVQQLQRQTLPLTTIAGLVVPDLISAPDEPGHPNGPPVAWWLTPGADWEKAAGANALEWNTYVGLGIVLLGLVALVAGPRRTLLPALGLLLCYAFAQGWPGARLLYHLPGLGAGAPNRILALTWFLWPWLAALGVRALVESEPPGSPWHDTRPRLARATLIAAAATTLGAALWVLTYLDPPAFAAQLQQTLLARYADLDPPATSTLVEAVVPLEAATAAGQRLLDSARGVSLTAACLLLSGLALALGRRPRLATALVLLCVLSEGAFHARAHLPAHDPGDLSLFPQSPALQAVAAAADGGRVVRMDSSGGVAEVEALARPNLLQVYGIADLTPWTVFTPGGLVELVGGLDPGARFRSGIACISDPALLTSPLLDLLRVSCVLSVEPLESPALELAFERPGFHVYRRRGALAPARIVPLGIATPGDPIARGLLISGGFDPATGALLAPGVQPQPAALGASEALIEVLDRPSKNRLDLVVRGSRGGLLVMHEQWYPGWQATINGETAEILRVDHVYRGLWLPEGDLTIRTRYAPRSLKLGLLCALASLVLAAYLGLVRGW